MTTTISRFVLIEKGVIVFSASFVHINYVASFLNGCPFLSVLTKFLENSKLVELSVISSAPIVKWI